MDWYVETPDVHRAAELRHEIGDYLRRHAAPNQNVDDAVLVVAELLNNVVDHAGGPLWVSVSWSGPAPVMTVTDLGQGFALEDIRPPAPDALRGRGLAIAASLAMALDVRTREAGGTKVEVLLPVRRPIETSIDPPHRATNALPDLSEASSEGFGRQAFLRALVVQLAQETERRDGPAAAEALVAQVGTDVGSKMEEEYRRTYGIEGPLTPEQLAHCYVRLKRAIEGDFHPVEVTPERIVLANRRCPFGEAVRHAPALCRMTSSVFGGIAARNGDGATVILEERIAVGDPQCRVIVELGRPSLADDGPGHRYLPPREPEH